ncbi:MAG: hypothetical protein L6R40_008610 [Gallowayella cf. fulva]|nr:MAG: hypothetical protein L6R40_008610 [Xanthomendoza cf. fulva]
MQVIHVIPGHIERGVAQYDVVDDTQNGHFESPPTKTATLFQPEIRIPKHEPIKLGKLELKALATESSEYRRMTFVYKDFSGLKHVDQLAPASHENTFYTRRLQSADFSNFSSKSSQQKTALQALGQVFDADDDRSKTAVIKESLRITALATSRLPLVSPMEPLIYDNWKIPAGTPISMTIRDILLDPTIFVNPNAFAPERWLSDNPNLQRMNQAYVPFGRGTRICVGIKYVLSLPPPYLKMDPSVLSTYQYPSEPKIQCSAPRFELQLYDTIRERDIDTARDFFIAETSPESPGVRAKVVKAKGSAK